MVEARGIIGFNLCFLDKEEFSISSLGLLEGQVFNIGVQLDFFLWGGGDILTYL